MDTDQLFTTEAPALEWVVVPDQEAYPKGTLHPSNAPEVRARLTWRILLQVCGIQLREYERENNDKEKIEWMHRIEKTINEANQINLSGLWGYQDEPPLPTPGFLVPNVAGIWLESLTSKLNSHFGSAIPALILKIES